MEILENNKTRLILTKDPENENCTKYIYDMIHHYIWELVNYGELGIKWIQSFSILANGLTKALFAGPFKKHWEERSLS